MALCLATTHLASVGLGSQGGCVAVSRSHRGSEVSIKEPVVKVLRYTRTISPSIKDCLDSNSSRSYHLTSSRQLSTITVHQRRISISLRILTMVLGFGGFFGLSTTRYREKLKSARPEDLKKQEVVKTRARLACTWSIISGFVSAHFTFGGSLLVSGIGGRKWRVADRKLGMIRKELTSRGVPLHKLDLKDVGITLVGVAAGTAAGAGIDVGIGSLFNIGDVTSGFGHTPAPTNGSHLEELQAIFSHPAHSTWVPPPSKSPQPYSSSDGCDKPDHILRPKSVSIQNSSIGNANSTWAPPPS